MADAKRTQTTKDVSLLQQLFKSGQLKLAPAFQRQAVWPRPAKAYLIDTILADRPIPLLFFTREISAQTGRPTYTVVDGQQRLRAIFEFLDNRLRLPTTAATNKSWRGLRFKQLSTADRDRLLNYDLSVVELAGYEDDDIRDVFVRMNRYVVKLAPQELRHAREKGAFKEFTAQLAKVDFWETHRIFTPNQIKRMRNVEIMAELVILLAEGPQDKKESIDLYYHEYADGFPEADEIQARLAHYQQMISDGLPTLATTRWRKPVDFYALIGAMDFLSDSGVEFDAQTIGTALRKLEKDLASDAPTKIATRYLAAASRQTDNIQPRETRIEIIANSIGQ
jgi:hypothetical protein